MFLINITCTRVNLTHNPNIFKEIGILLDFGKSFALWDTNTLLGGVGNTLPGRKRFMGNNSSFLAYLANWQWKRLPPFTCLWCLWIFFNTFFFLPPVYRCYVVKNLPVKARGQVQLKFWPTLLHRPAFWHGNDPHGLYTSQRGPEYKERQLQL